MLIANLYSKLYQIFSLDLSREELTNLTIYLQEEKENKFKELSNIENDIRIYQQNGGLILLDAQVKNLVDNISQLEAQKNAATIELNSRQKEYNSLSDEIKRIDPTLTDYVKGRVDELYLNELQTSIAELETKRDIESTIPQDEALKEKTLNDYNKKIEPLQRTFEEKFESLKQLYSQELLTKEE